MPKTRHLYRLNRQLYNAHYVNIAWGNFFLACLFVCEFGQLFAFLYRFKTIREKSNVLHVGWYKKHDRKNYRRDGRAEGQKRQGVFGKIPFKYNQLILPNIWVFCPVGCLP